MHERTDTVRNGIVKQPNVPESRARLVLLRALTHCRKSLGQIVNVRPAKPQKIELVDLRGLESW
jgi:hypothetical protein